MDSIPVTVRTHLDKTITEKMVSPCKGRDAKVLAKARLEEKLKIPATFKSYQEAAGKPERPLADEENVLRNSILNFSVATEPIFERLHHHDELLKEIYEDRINILLSKYSARLVSCAVRNDKLPDEQGGLANLIQSDELLSSRVTAALVSSDMDCTPVTFGRTLDQCFGKKNNVAHTNTSEQLRKEMKRMHDRGVLQLMAEEMPLECQIIKYYDVFLQLLED